MVFNIIFLYWFLDEYVIYFFDSFISFLYKLGGGDADNDEIEKKIGGGVPENDRRSHGVMNTEKKSVTKHSSDFLEFLYRRA